MGRRKALRNNEAWRSRIAEDIDLAILANGGDEFKEEACTCDPAVGMVPCAYCAIFYALKGAKQFVVFYQHLAEEGGTRGKEREKEEDQAQVP